jgi:dihydrofolate reductase
MRMRKLILFNLITLDGYFAGPNGEIDWHNVDDEFNEFAIEQLNTVDTILFGRVTYQMMASYWPTPTAISDDPIVAEKMNQVPKIVVSRTLKQADWQNTRLITDHVEEEIKNLKQQPGKNLFIFGSAGLAAALTPLHLIDEYRLIVNPVVLGTGTPLFKNIQSRLNFKLINTRIFRSGNVLLYYQPA